MINNKLLEKNVFLHLFSRNKLLLLCISIEYLKVIKIVF